MGWTVIHFWGKDILKDTEQCVRAVSYTHLMEDMDYYHQTYGLIQDFTVEKDWKCW